MPGTKSKIALSQRTVQRILCLLAIVTVAACQQYQPQPLQQRFLQFGTIIDVTLVTADESLADQQFTAIENLLKKRHREWHGWMDGDLKRFNDALINPPGRRVDIPASLARLIAESTKYYHITGGLFNPALGKLVAAWGFHQPRTADQALIAQLQHNIPGMHDLHVESSQAYTNNPHFQLDFGAIAKGLAVRQIADLLRAAKIDSYIINAGGDVFAAGRKPQGSWRVAIENPFDSSIIAGLDMTGDSSIFTSGNYRRYYTDENQDRQHHIIHPQTGKPSTAISSATVLHRDPVIADIAATTLMLAEISQLDTLSKKLGIKSYLVIGEDKKLHISRPLYAKIQWQQHEDFDIQIH